MSEENNLFIPKTIKVGFKEREDTYTGKLAYVIFKDNKGILRKQKSWEQWRDKAIDPLELSNDPQDGLCLNKDVKRYNWSHFGSNRSYIRVYDPRGIEFEITPENLIGILTETDCLKRGLDGKFVYAWEGKNLILLPCNSEAYQKAVEHTARQDKKVSSKEIKPGYAYVTKTGEDVVYLGKFNWIDTEWDYAKGQRTTKKVESKVHVFATPGKPTNIWDPPIFKKKDLKFLASVTSASEVLNYAELLENFNSTTHASPFVSFEHEPKESEFETWVDNLVPDETNLTPYGHHVSKTFQVNTISGDVVSFCTLSFSKYLSGVYSGRDSYVTLRNDYSLNTKTMELKHLPYNDNYRNIGLEEARKLSKQSIKVTGVLANGRKKEIKDSNSMFT